MPSTSGQAPTGEYVHAVGIGPGNPAYLHARAQSILRTADVVVGFETVLDCLDSVGIEETLRCSYETQEDRLEQFANRLAAGETGAVALMGDPNVSGGTFLERIEDRCERSLRVIPGISSIQIAASRSRTPLEDSAIVSLHRRGDLGPAFDRLEAAAGKRHLIVLPRPYDVMPETIADRLLECGVPEDSQVEIHERLSFPDERLHQQTLGELAAAGQRNGSAFSDLTVMVVPADR